MKKTFITLSLLVITILMVCVLSASASVKGDVDGDGEVTASDARLALRMSVNLESKKDAADADNNGSITASDARLILRASVGLEDLNNIVTEPEDPTTKPEEPSTNPWEDPNYDDSNLDIMSIYEPSPERAGLIYNEDGYRTTYEEVEEGDVYFIYTENGYVILKRKPYSPGNEPPEVDLTVCKYCGKHKQPYDGEHYACYYGYCDRFMCDTECPECGVFVKANTCHSCK